jgi:D-glycero-D-manno-heptose 1,7-bisphosphate phosphatase
VVIITNQSAVARNYISLKELDAIHEKMKDDLKQVGAYVDGIYFCPHHPGLEDAGINSEFIMDCQCRKPKPGMLFRAAEDLQIDLDRSYLIGDTERDILAGKDAGCKTIGVRTGKNIDNYSVEPDQKFDHVLDAVKYILLND